MRETLLLIACCIVSLAASAQNLTIVNARIIDGTGIVIERGSILIADGRIAGVSPGAGPTTGNVLDADGMTALPGFIDTHRHDFVGNVREPRNRDELVRLVEENAPVNLELLLSEGFTTVMVPAIDLSVGLDLRDRLARGELKGPRMLTTGPGITAPGDHPVGSICGGQPFCGQTLAREVRDAAHARETVRELAAAGVDAIKVVVDRSNVPSVTLDLAIVREIIDETHAHRLPVIVHAETVGAMSEVAALGADRFAHTPNDRAVSQTQGWELLRERAIPIATTASFSSPQFLTAGGRLLREGGEERHEQILANVRFLWDQGVTVAFGTDSPPGIRPIVEIEQLATRLSSAEVIAALTVNAAGFLDMEDEIGTLETGKIADLVLVRGDPIADIHALGDVVVVVQGGRIAIER